MIKREINSRVSRAGLTSLAGQSLRTTVIDDGQMFLSDCYFLVKKCTVSVNVELWKDLRFRRWFLKSDAPCGKQNQAVHGIMHYG